MLDRTTVGNALPAPDAVAAVKAGRTTRAQVIALLGAPDEYRQGQLDSALTGADSPVRRALQPASLSAFFTAPPGEQSSQAIRVAEEHDLFHRARFTWVREQRGDRAWMLWPLFTDVATETRVDRLTVMFDERDVVKAVGVERGIDAP